MWRSILRGLREEYQRSKIAVWGLNPIVLGPGLVLAGLTGGWILVLDRAGRRILVIYISLPFLGRITSC